MREVPRAASDSLSSAGETCSVVPTLERHTYKMLSRSKGTTIQDIEAGCISVCYVKQGTGPSKGLFLDIQENIKMLGGPKL